MVPHLAIVNHQTVSGRYRMGVVVGMSDAIGFPGSFQQAGSSSFSVVLLGYAYRSGRPFSSGADGKGLYWQGLRLEVNVNFTVSTAEITVKFHGDPMIGGYSDPFSFKIMDPLHIGNFTNG